MLVDMIISLGDTLNLNQFNINHPNITSNKFVGQWLEQFRSRVSRNIGIEKNNYVKTFIFSKFYANMIKDFLTKQKITGNDILKYTRR